MVERERESENNLNPGHVVIVDSVKSSVGSWIITVIITVTVITLIVMEHRDTDGHSRLYNHSSVCVFVQSVCLCEVVRVLSENLAGGHASSGLSQPASSSSVCCLSPPSTRD